MSGNIATAHNSAVFVAAETVPGTKVWPTNCILITEGDSKQERQFIESKELVESRGKPGQIAGPYKAGEFNFGAYLKPSGVLGTPPSMGPVLKAWMGTETIVGATSVTYGLASLGDPIQTLSVLFRKGHKVTWIGGWSVDKGTPTIKGGSESDDSILSVAFSGQYMNKTYVEATTVAVAIDGGTTPTTTFTVTNPQKLASGVTQKINIGTDDNTAAGFTITDVNQTTGVVTVTPAIATDQAIGAYVVGFIPPITDIGTPVHCNFGAVQQDSGDGLVDITVMEVTSEMTNGFKVKEDEKTNSDFPILVTDPEKRMITVGLSQYCRADTGDAYDFHADNQTDLTLNVMAGNTAGSRCEFKFSGVQIKTPEFSGDAEITTTVAGESYDPSGSDNNFKIELA